MGDNLDTLFITSAATGQTGELDGCRLSTPAALSEAVTDGLFEKYACAAGTDAASCMAFFNVMRNR